MTRHPSRRKRPSRKRRRLTPLWAVIAAHAAVLGAALLVYALPHHVIPRQETAVGLRSSRESLAQTTTAPAMEPTIAPTPESAPTQSAQIAEIKAEATSEPTAEPTPAPTDAPGSFKIKFADKFSDEIQATDSTYISPNVNISVQTIRYGDSDCHVADIYISDISYLVTAFGEGEFGRGYTEYPRSFAKRFDALITLSGDYYGARSDGVVIRNGVLYRDKTSSRDVCVVYWDGSMKTLKPQKFDAEAEMANGAYQAWNFGPMLLDSSGQPMTSFNSDVIKANPRSAIGYFEPGHYCFVMVEGRNDDSEGLTMTQLSKFMHKLGCTQAYNMDGGQSAALLKLDEHCGEPADGGREVSDVIMILDYILE